MLNTFEKYIQVYNLLTKSDKILKNVRDNNNTEIIRSIRINIFLVRFYVTQTL